jgi:NADH:ubiquinone oxidoreductase subunit 6 (subunit J)
MEAVVFWFAAVLAVAGAVGVVLQRNPFYSVLALVVHLIALAVLFLLLRAEFLAAAQVIVYAGAVMVLYVFVVAYVGGLEDSLTEPTPALRVLAVVFAGALLAELSVAIVGSGLKALDTHGAGLEAGFGSPSQIGELFLTKFLIAFELVSLLLLIAAVGAIVLAGREREPETSSRQLPDRRLADDRTS